MAPSKFSGTDGISAVRWLRSLIHDLPAGLTAGQWLERVDGLLIGDAARWAEQHPDVLKILTEEHLAIATPEDVETFKTAFKVRFAPIEYLDMDTVDLQLLTLKQTPFESMEAYYQRTETLLAALLHASGAMDSIGEILVDLEQSCLKRVIGVFAQGIRNDAARKEAVAYMSQRITEREEYSLHCVYKHAESLSQQKGLNTETDQKRSSLIQFCNNSLSLHPSQPPPLTFTGLFGSVEESHDSYTRSEYGPHFENCVGELRSLIVSAHGSFGVPRLVASGAWGLLSNTPTEAYKNNLPRIGAASNVRAALPREPSTAERLGGLTDAVRAAVGDKGNTSPKTTTASVGSSDSSGTATIPNENMFSTASISNPSFTVHSNAGAVETPATTTTTSVCVSTPSSAARFSGSGGFSGAPSFNPSSTVHANNGATTPLQRGFDFSGYGSNGGLKIEDGGGGSVPSFTESVAVREKEAERIVGISPDQADTSLTLGFSTTKYEMSASDFERSLCSSPTSNPTSSRSIAKAPTPNQHARTNNNTQISTPCSINTPRPALYTRKPAPVFAITSPLSASLPLGTPPLTSRALIASRVFGQDYKFSTVGSPTATMPQGESPFSELQPSVAALLGQGFCQGP